jgi:hypothetical protein
MTFGQFANSVVAICMTMFQLSVVSGIFILEIQFYSQNGAFKVTPFTPDFYKDLVFFLMRCCKPIQLRAVNFFGLSLQSFTSVESSASLNFVVTGEFFRF